MLKRINKKLFVQISILITTFLLPLFIGIYQPLTTFNTFYNQEGTKSVYKYTTHQTDNIESLRFNTAEMSHLDDVRNVFCIVWIVLIVNIIFIYANSKDVENDLKHIWEKNIKISGILAFVVLFFTVFNFRDSFIVFHQIFFPQGNWSFDSTNSNLIQLFPEEIFVSFFNYYVIIFVLSILIVSFEIALWERTQKIKKSY
jgi:integral membrane protein (TIGR01906 family)